MAASSRVTQVNGRVPKETAFLLAVAVKVTVFNAGRGFSLNAAITAALENWTAGVLRNHPSDAAKALSTMLAETPDLDRSALTAKLDELQLKPLARLVGQPAEPDPDPRESTDLSGPTAR